ncbi:phosphoribosylanthranilate isomerase [Flavobacterium sp. J27]|uniref:phosphoribosylanthranilate isomerase n=1 Tax=Flavobacterium sp. J27 TaxID=2060419 RepID=UPI0010314045|nr:phosphoribosylanthranilate isomerase [Flavobacterium sp. J27]
MLDVKLKICGMKYPENIEDICTLNPDYLGFIFWEKSLRKFTDEEIIDIPKNIKKIAVFVNEELGSIKSIIKQFGFDAVQLHGSESPELCKEIKNLGVEVVKSFSIDETFDFNLLSDYDDSVDLFLFDTKGKLPGGNGISFDWNLLLNYNLTKPFFLSGGIGLTSVDAIKSFLNTSTAKYCYGIDVNSRFEKKVGFKNYSKLRRLKRLLYEDKI